MITLTCPKCRQGLPDDDLDGGQCHLCGFPLDGPVVLSSHAGRKRVRVLFAMACAVLVTVGVGLVLTGRVNPVPQPNPESSPAPTDPPSAVAVPLAPHPHEPKPSADPVPLPVEPPKIDVRRPVGVVMKVDPKIAAKRHFDHPDDTAALPDLNTGDRVILTGKVRVLRLGSVNGKGSLDASGLISEEIIITGDLNNEASVLLNAPNGKVTVGGYVIGASKLTVTAPGGEVTVASTGRVTGGAVVTAIAKRFEVKCPLSGGAKVNVTLTAGGSLRLTRSEDGATITYRQSAASDPAPHIERGAVLGGATVVERK